MKLFVLMHQVPYEGGDCLDVYSSKELAQKAKMKAAEPRHETGTRRNGTTYTLTFQRDLDHLDIEEFELDE